jgi:hypothetical protein
MESIEIWRAAGQMRKLYGADAAIHAAMRADKLMDQGDIDGFNMWKRVVAALDELKHLASRDGAAIKGNSPTGDRYLYDFYR